MEEISSTSSDWIVDPLDGKGGVDMPKRGNKLELYFITALTCFYLLFFIMSFYLPRIAGKVPKLICGIAIILCLIVLVKELFGKKKATEAAETVANQGIPFHKTLLVLVAYTVALLFFGFPLSTFGVLAFVPILLGAKNNWKNMVISFLSTGVLYLVFVKLFYVRLPMGIIFESILR